VLPRSAVAARAVPILPSRGPTVIGASENHTPSGFRRSTRRSDAALPSSEGSPIIVQAVIVLVFVVFFGAILLALQLGRRAGARRAERDPEGAAEGFGALDGAVYGLMGLLIAFTFSGAAARFDARRTLITHEANTIGTAYLRLDLLPSAAQPALRHDFRAYVAARIAVFGDVLDAVATDRAQADANAELAAIWTAAVASVRTQPSPAVATLVISSLNDMIDITTERAVAVATHPPPTIYVLLGLAILVSSVLAGYAMGAKKSSSRLHVLGFAAIMTASVYVIVDMEYPRAGFIRIDAADQVLYDLRDTMRP
jgi:hypothetical protein